MSLRYRTFDLPLVSWYNGSDGHGFLTGSHLWVTGLDTEKGTARVRALLCPKGILVICSRRCVMLLDPNFWKFAGWCLLAVFGLIVLPLALCMGAASQGIEMLVRWVKDAWG